MYTNQNEYCRFLGCSAALARVVSEGPGSVVTVEPLRFTNSHPMTFIFQHIYNYYRYIF